eukprot:m.115876 g.115876  ORF g.115876 m.115876 type:complete len:109 (-) comp17156_c0_seq14:56-382(-)
MDLCSPTTLPRGGTVPQNSSWETRSTDQKWTSGPSDVSSVLVWPGVLLRAVCEPLACMCSELMRQSASWGCWLSRWCVRVCEHDAMRSCVYVSLCVYVSVLFLCDSRE